MVTEDNQIITIDPNLDSNYALELENIIQNLDEKEKKNKKEMLDMQQYLLNNENK